MNTFANAVKDKGIGEDYEESEIIVKLVTELAL
jgi:hypothetical protein